MLSNDFSEYERNLIKACLNMAIQMAGYILAFDHFLGHQNTWKDLIYTLDKILKKI